MNLHLATKTNDRSEVIRNIYHWIELITYFERSCMDMQQVAQETFMLKIE